MAERPPRRILVVALHNLGDAVLGSGLLPALRRLYPEARLGLWVKEYAREVFDFPAGSVRMHFADPFWDTAPGRGKGRFGPFLRALSEVRAERYDLALVLDSDWRRALACRLAGVARSVGAARRKSGLFLTQAVLDDASGHVIESHARLLSAAASVPVPADWLVPDIGLSDEQKSRGAAWRAGLGWQDAAVAAVHPISGDPEKNWPLDRWARFIREACARRPFLRVAVLSSPKEEGALRAALAAAAPGRAQVVVGSIARIKEILSQAAVFAGGDSGPGHMAAALGIPVLSLFGPTEPARYRPVGAGRVSVLRRRPLRELPVEEALESFSALWPATRPS